MVIPSTKTKVIRSIGIVMTAEVILWAHILNSWRENILNFEFTFWDEQSEGKYSCLKILIVLFPRVLGLTSSFQNLPAFNYELFTRKKPW